MNVGSNGILYFPCYYPQLADVTAESAVQVSNGSRNVFWDALPIQLGTACFQKALSVVRANVQQTGKQPPSTIPSPRVHYCRFRFADCWVSGVTNPGAITAESDTLTAVTWGFIC